MPIAARTTALALAATVLCAQAEPLADLKPPAPRPPIDTSITLDHARMLMSPPDDADHTGWDGAIPDIAPAAHEGAMVYARTDDANIDPLFRWRTAPSPVRALDADTIIRLRAGRTTSLRDGGIEANHGSIGQPSSLSSFTSSNGELDFYDLALDFDAAQAGAFTLVVTTGVRAVQGQFGQSFSSSSLVGEHEPLSDSRGVVAVPVAGGGFRLALADNAFFRTTATADAGGPTTMLDFTAEYGLDVSERFGLRWGYQMIRSDLEFDNYRVELDREGVFARIEIRF